jgi:hypothetical protein
MAVEISREAQFGPGSKGFRFAVRHDEGVDRHFYETGRKLEDARFRKGSMGQRIFDRLSGNGHAASTQGPADPQV